MARLHRRLQEPVDWADCSLFKLEPQDFTIWGIHSNQSLPCVLSKCSEVSLRSRRELSPISRRKTLRWSTEGPIDGLWMFGDTSRAEIDPRNARKNPTNDRKNPQTTANLKSVLFGGTYLADCWIGWTRIGIWNCKTSLIGDSVGSSLTTSILCKIIARLMNFIQTLGTSMSHEIYYDDAMRPYFSGSCRNWKCVASLLF